MPSDKHVDMFKPIPFLAAMLTAATFSAARADPINCTAASDDVEQTICATPKLKAQDQAISTRLNTLTQRCPAARELLLQGQAFWLRERWDCRNVEGAFDRPGALSSCLAARMDRRIEQLASTGADCDFTSLEATYRFVDVDYMLRFGDSYIDKPVTVAGMMDLDSCRAPDAEPTAAVLVGHDPEHDRLRVTFSAMPAAQRGFLCDKRPSSHWAGTIKHDRHGNHLFLTDLLGQELPVP